MFISLSMTFKYCLQETQTTTTPDWVIVLSVLGAVLFIAVVAVIVVAIVKL